MSRRVIGFGIATTLVVLASWWAVRVRQRFEDRRQRCGDMCELAGRCQPLWRDVILDRRGACVAKSEEDCERACTYAGRCHLSDEACVAIDHATCAASERCEELGECHLRNADEAPATLPFPTFGLVNLAECGPRDDDDCLRSTACRDHGRCRKGDHHCVKP